MRVGGPQTWCRHFGEEKDVLLLLAFEPQLYRLYQLSYSGSSTHMDIVTNAGIHLSKKHLEHLNSYQLSKEVPVS